MQYDENLFAQLESGEGVDKNWKTEVTNPHFNWYKHSPSQQLHDSLVAESIQMSSPDMYYIRREYVNPDLVFGEDMESKFEKAWKFAAYIESYASYEGQRTFFGKFGIQANDEMTIEINPRLFMHQTDNQPPKLGDLVYFPMDKSLFEITWIEIDPFYQFGDKPIRKINMTKFVYSGEEIKPTLQINDGINVSEDDDLDLDAVRNLDMLADINVDQYAEQDQIKEETDEFIQSLDVVNGVGKPVNGRNKIFSDF